MTSNPSGESYNPKRPGKNKHQWSTIEDAALIEALMQLNNAGDLRNKNEKGFRLGHGLKLQQMLETHGDAEQFRYKSLAYYEELSVIFGGDRASGKDAQVPADIVEEIDKVVVDNDESVKLTFDATDYVHVLQRLQHDVKEEPLSVEQLGFVRRVLEAFGDCFTEKHVPDVLINSLLIPDSLGILMPALALVYNDAAWMKNISPEKHLVHPSINDDLAKILGVQSLRNLSLVDEQTTRDLPCIDYASICELMAFYGDFQAASLTVVFEGTTLSIEEVCSLHLPPPWKVQGSALYYRLGMISGYFL
ncbi:hypothetical protein ZIOFF_039479 [Zingiber officinale]|uniref:Myb/SANT-like domain-containing protein n=1 Tax=Zingiber officinale TaxID=94328 RepID=A0A8J5KU80_ZINOF|nr:hypothetical protein ZIOFF_039479 [Zingiber officinale]